MKLFKYIIVGILVIILLVVGFIWSHPYRIDVRKIPKYQDTSFWKIETSFFDGELRYNPTARILFNTTDKPEDVNRFYKDRLSKLGWNLRHDGKILQQGFGDTGELRLGETGDIQVLFSKGSATLSLSSSFYYNPNLYKDNYQIKIYGRKGGGY